MDIKLNAKESLRIITHDFCNVINFIDVESLKDQLGLKITNWSLRNQYIEIRRKDNQIAMFVFSKKGDKKYVDLDWWEDAEVVYCINEVKHGK